MSREQGLAFLFPQGSQVATVACGGHAAEQVGTPGLPVPSCQAAIPQQSCSGDRYTTAQLSHSPTYGTILPPAGCAQKAWVCLAQGGLSLLPRAPACQHSRLSLVACFGCRLHLRAPRPPRYTRGPLSALGPLQRVRCRAAACHLPELFKSALSVNVF